MKNLNEIDIGIILKELLNKMGKKNTILVVVNGVALVALVTGGILINNKFQKNFSENDNKIVELQKEETLANRNKKEIEDLKIKIAELKENEYQSDLAVQTTETLKEIENLMIEYSFVNSAHKVEQTKNTKALVEVPIQIEYIGPFSKSVQFLEELNNSKLPIALRDLKFNIPEEEYENYIETGNVKTSLTVYVTDDVTNVENKGSKIKIQTLSNPFGYYVYKKKEEPIKEGETIDSYQQYLQQFTKEKIKEEIQNEKNGQINAGDSSTSSMENALNGEQTNNNNNSNNINNNDVSNTQNQSSSPVSGLNNS
ncbi:hypothetical protein [Bacillus thuringiensis]|uniref:hypothetical protein n=1 Tax=Bacillus thuringiensis TaxID=1428 RepID=UPI0021D66895|nr:hypothetical protein [Bacillus thuringiensis]MCU7667089.1 hypothetical protein [Bacillus thuringiensis]